MAGVEALAQRIRRRAEQEAEEVKAEARRRAENILAQARARAQKEREVILARAGKEAAERKRRLLVQAEMEARRQRLRVKDELVDKAFELAIKNLRELPTAEYQAFIEPLLVAAAETGEEEVIVAPHDRERLNEAFLARVNEKLKAQGKAGRLTLAAETRPLEGGFILRAGGVENNYSFELILKLSRDELEQEVAAVLFPAG
ncbi:MAG: V/A-type H+/Na+-transporting ATPase subunit [Bacillota bacterium]|jgi:V/A-type H+-transporting ATPase subunit E|nr:V/A-type H+/Na+-transporting ATPase subunit [Bacillota bacterium]MDK2882224.1 V/A-type H+/Na+-transporting ATPase subunit [Bacillota bacterium]MDK2959944.1 V/A-type H+/Na+-transporting ATPase subunit [Bacillota bacterium]